MRAFELLTRFVRRLVDPRSDVSRVSAMSSNGEAPSYGADGASSGHLGHVLLNVPLMLGGVIVLVLFGTVLFGPVMAPQNPYLSGRHVTEYIDGELISPPFPPGDQYPLGTDELGRDTLSMLLYGARNTLVAAAFVTMARLTVGLVLGGLAGWHKGQLVDRLVMGAIQMLISVPMLLSAAILILALDIRRGFPVFVVALCIVGWGEIAQAVRAEFIRIKRQPYLDSGRAIGLNSLGLAVRRVLPNVLPTLIVITLLEMGAVLMILGELGFVGVYIGGGTAVQVDDFTQQQYFTMPEWGAMMAGSRQWARAKPWMILFPALAFFVSVTGFNLLGEGLRRLVDRGIFNTAILLSWRTIVVAVLITAASVYVTVTLGPAPSYRQLAHQVDQESLMADVALLGGPDTHGRGVGSPEAERIARHLADVFEANGLGAVRGSRLREVTFTLARPVESPELKLVDEEGGTLARFSRWGDYSETLERHGGSGEAEGPVTLVLFAAEGGGGRSPEWRYERFKGLELRGRVAMVMSGNAPRGFDTEALIRGAGGVLIVSPDVGPHNQVLSGEYLEQPTLPVFRITPEAADVILAEAGLDVEAIDERIEALAGGQSDWVAHELESRVRMRLRLGDPETVTAYNVMGVVSGSDAALDDELVIVSCHYDGLGQSPGGTVLPGANGNASGGAVMSEIVRLWHEREFQPRRSVLFAAWAGGELPYSGAHMFRDQSTFLTQYDISSVFHLDRLGGGSEGGLVARQMGGRDELYEMLTDSAASLGLSVSDGLEHPRHPYQEFIVGEHDDSYVALYGSLLITWGNPDPALAADTLENVDPAHLAEAAEAVNLTLIRAVHEPRY